LESARRESDGRLDQTLEFEKRLFVEDDIVDIGQSDTALGEAIGNGVRRIGRVMAATREAFLLRRSYDSTIGDESRRAIVIEGRNAEDLHVKTRYKRTVLRPTPL